MSLENHHQEPVSDGEEESRQSVGRTKQIKKNPKPPREQAPTVHQAGGGLFPLPPPEFRVFESEEQKHQRITKFWKEEIDGYYKREVGPEER